MPLISIIMPLWDGAYKTIDRAVNSIVQQWFKEPPPTMEIIFVGDGPKDRATLRKATGWARRLKNGQELLHIDAKLTKHLLNLGVSSARISGIRSSRGKYICYLDSDDVYYPCAIEEMYLALERNSVDVVNSPVELLTWDFDLEEYKTYVGYTNNTLLGKMHTREIYDNVGGYIPNLISKEWHVLSAKLPEKTMYTTKVCGKCILAPTGQYFTERPPSSDLGVTYSQHLKKENNDV